MPIFVYNKKTEYHEGPNVYSITRPSILSNPYTHIQDKNRTTARYVVGTREEAIQMYDHYFDVMYNGNKEFKDKIDEIYEKYKSGQDIYLGCVCKPLPCHGDIIAKKIMNKFVKENFLKNGRTLQNIQRKVE